MNLSIERTPREVMDIRQCAAYLGISPDTLYMYADTGFLPAFKLGNRWRFKRELIDSWMIERSKKNGKG
jgi:excisionase family DNA binding protein